MGEALDRGGSDFWNVDVIGRRWVDLLGRLADSMEILQIILRYAHAHLDPPLGGQHWRPCSFPAVYMGLWQQLITLAYGGP